MLSAGCAIATSTTSEAGSPLRIVAAENFWGSIAGQLGGSKVSVSSGIDRPGMDPHDYDPTARDARAFARAQLVVVNGLGDHPWAQQLLAADPVGQRLGLKDGDVVGVGNR